MKSFFQKTHFQSDFTKPPPSPIFGAKWTMWHVTRQNCHGRKLRSLLPKTAPKSFFRKICFLVRFYETAPLTYFQGPTDYGALRGKIVTDENFARFCLKWHKNRFSEKYVSGPFLRNCPPHLFSGQNGLCGGFRGEIVTDENFAHLCLKRPRN